MLDNSDKVMDLENRIRKIDDQIRDLEDTKFNLMSLKREFHMDGVKKTLEDSFTDELKDMLKEKLDD
jgi:DUF1365 family protein|tara:strand:- start:1112 stop:1312 length:201 start_codon:yes stop_codon:yes gene_type:complete